MTSPCTSILFPFSSKAGGGGGKNGVGEGKDLGEKCVSSEEADESELRAWRGGGAGIARGRAFEKDLLLGPGGESSGKNEEEAVGER